MTTPVFPPGPADVGCPPIQAISATLVWYVTCSQCGATARSRFLYDILAYDNVKAGRFSTTPSRALCPTCTGSVWYATYP